MLSYEIRVKTWTDDWSIECEFQLLIEALDFAHSHYPQNDWLIFDNSNGRTVHVFNQSEALREVSSNDLDRFSRVSLWLTNRRYRERERERSARRLERLREIGRPSSDWRVSMDFCFKVEDSKVNWKEEGF